MIGESFSTALELFICRVEEAVKHQERAFANSVGVNVFGFFFCFVLWIWVFLLLLVLQLSYQNNRSYGNWKY